MFNLDYFKSEYMWATDSISVSVGFDGAEHNGFLNNFLNNENFLIFLRYLEASN